MAFQTDFLLEDFKDSLVIFDDLEMINSKKLKDKILKLQDSMLCDGRHKNISVCVANHSAANGKETKLIINEARDYRFVLQGTWFKSIKIYIR